jgi:hypothetical protein
MEMGIVVSDEFVKTFFELQYRFKSVRLDLRRQSCGLVAEIGSLFILVEP